MSDPVIIEIPVKAAYLIAKGLSNERTIANGEFAWIFQDIHAFREVLAEIRSDQRSPEVEFAIRFPNVFYRERAHKRKFIQSLGLSR